MSLFLVHRSAWYPGGILYIQVPPPCIPNTTEESSIVYLYASIQCNHLPVRPGSYIGFLPVYQHQIVIHPLHIYQHHRAILFLYTSTTELSSSCIPASQSYPLPVYQHHTGVATYISMYTQWQPLNEYQHQSGIIYVYASTTEVSSIYKGARVHPTGWTVNQGCRQVSTPV